MRGILEPVTKRSVEGDLGVRVSAGPLWQILEPQVAETLSPSAQAHLESWVNRISDHPEILPQTDEEQEYDEILATGCLLNALRRHSGTVEPVWTSHGQTWVQTGKDLRRISKLVLTGGYPSSNPGFSLPSPTSSCAFKPERSEKTSLVPHAPATLIDRRYLWPLLGNLVRQFPEQTCRFAIDSLDAVSHPSLAKES